MIGQNNQNSYEELSFGKIIGRMSRKKDSQYALFHLKILLPRDEEDLVGVDYNTLKGYIRGACFGKLKRELFLYNGISEKTRDGSHTKIKFSPLKETELEKLVEDANIPRRFKIKTIK